MRRHRVPEPQNEKLPMRKIPIFAMLGLAVLAQPAQPDTFRLGPAEAILASDAIGGWQVDGPVFAVRAGAEVRLFVTVGIQHSRFATYVLRGPSLQQLTNGKERVIGPGCSYTDGCAEGPDINRPAEGITKSERVFDACGAWLLGAITPAAAGNPIQGYYHAEELCNYSAGQTLKSVGHAISEDGGLHFRRLGQILSAKDQPAITGVPTAQAPSFGVMGQGDHSVIEWQGTPWMYFSGTDNSGPTGVARRDPSGVWRKWRDAASGFSEPALGGASGGLPGVWARSASKSREGELYLIGYDLAAAPNSIFLWRSTDGLNFARSTTPLMTLSDMEPQQNPPLPAEERILYPSLVPPGGDSYRDSWGSSVWLFYGLEDRPHDPTTNGPFSSIPGARKLVRREVSVSFDDSSSDRSVIALSRYFNTVRLDHWITTQVVDPGYRLESVLGYLLTTPERDTQPLFECYIPSWDDHMLATDPSCGGWPRLRRLGWLHTLPAAGRVPLIRCFIEPWSNHFANNAIDCGGWTTEMILGYLEQ